MGSLQGTLELFALPDVFRLLSQNKVTGALRVARDSGDGVIYFRNGEVYFAFSNITREFLGQRLVNAKLITQGQLLRILDEQKKSPDKRLGDLLVAKGIISKDLLETFLKEQIQDAIFDLLQWDIGAFSFEDGEESNQEVGLSVSVENLIMESSRRLEEWEVISRKIPSMDVIVRMSPTPPEDQMEINIKPEEWTLLVLADGKKTVRDIAGAAERSEFDTARIVYGLVTAGLLDVAGAPMPVAEQPPSREVIPPRPEHLPEPEISVPAAERQISVPAAERQVAVPPDSTVIEPVPAERSEPAARVVAKPAVPDEATSATDQDAAEESSEAAISKETLLRLIAGVRNL